jgi:hypothetical protein
VDRAGRCPSDPADGRSGAGDRRAGPCAGPAAGGDAAPTAVTAIPLLVFDAGYDPIALTCGLAEAGVRVAELVRIRSDRVFYTDPPRRAPGARGRPRKHGRRVALQEPASWPAPDDQLTVCDARYGQVTVAAWAGLHPKLWTRGRFSQATVPPIVRGTVVRVQVSRLPKPAGRLRVLWLWWAGPGAPDLDLLWRAYVRRFDIEHTLRFCKQTLGWVTPRVRHPEQADRWTWLLPPNSAWPGHWSPTNACRGNGGLIRIGSPHPCPTGVSPASRHPPGGRQGAETLPARTGAAQRLASRPSSPPSRHQKERRTGHPKPTSRLKRKLRTGATRRGRTRQA